MMKFTKTFALAFTVVLSLAACTDASDPGGAILPELKHDPILFVHGYARNGGNWQDMKARFAADGWQEFELYAYNYSFTASNTQSASEIRDQVNEIKQTTGATKVDIVAFSMG